MALLVKSMNPTASLGDEALGCRGQECRAHGAETSRAVPVPTLAKVYEDRAEDCTHAAEQTDDPVFSQDAAYARVTVETGRAGRSIEAADGAILTALPPRRATP
jgi:hypothetical protein